MNQTNNDYYHIGPHILNISSSIPIEFSTLLPSFTPFVLPSEEGEKLKTKIMVNIHTGEVAITEPINIIQPPVSFEWESSRCTLQRREDGSYLIGITPLDNPSAEAFADCSEHFQRNIIYLPESLLPKARFIVNNFLMLIYTFATAEQGTLMVHASVINYEGRGYLFLGKSGTGKSTHTSLWLKHIKGSSLLNDDNPVVSLNPKTGEATVYGTPWSGKTSCYLNESVPVGAFIRLEQASSNTINRLNDSQAFAALLPSCSCLKQDTAIFKGIINSVTHMVTNVPVFLLKCLPDEAAARLSMDTVTQTGK